MKVSGPHSSCIKGHVKESYYCTLMRFLLLSGTSDRGTITYPMLIDVVDMEFDL